MTKQANKKCPQATEVLGGPTIAYAWNSKVRQKQSTGVTIRYETVLYFSAINTANIC